MVWVAIDSAEGKKCAPPAPFFRQPAAPIDPDFQQGCSLQLCTLYSYDTRSSTLYCVLID
jgi:hypothetical protein